MKTQKQVTSDNKKLNDPGKVDPTKQDERDNDATRIRKENPEREREDPEILPGSTGAPGKKNRGESNSKDAPYKQVQHKPDPDEDEKQEGSEIHKGRNPATPGKGDPIRDDQGNPVMKGFGKGL